MSTIKKKVNVCNEVFKRLNNDLINVFARKFKFDRHESSETKVKFLRVIYEILFKITQLSRDLNSFINYDFLKHLLKMFKK